MTARCAIVEERSQMGDLDSIEGLLEEVEQELSRYEAEIGPMLD
jgi:hypothetical protein